MSTRLDGLRLIKLSSKDYSDCCYQQQESHWVLGDKTTTSLVGQPWVKRQVAGFFWNLQRILSGLPKSPLSWVWGCLVQVSIGFCVEKLDIFIQSQCPYGFHNSLRTNNFSWCSISPTSLRAASYQLSPWNSNKNPLFTCLHLSTWRLKLPGGSGEADALGPEIKGKKKKHIFRFYISCLFPDST